MKKILFSMLISIAMNGSQGAVITLIQNHEIDQPLLKKLKTIYLDAFSTIYKNYWTPELAQTIVNDFDCYLGDGNLPNHFILITASINSELVGWVLYNKYDNHTILEFLNINPNFWRQGIGKKLAFSIREYYPEVNRISLVSRKINSTSPHFYPSLGFRKTDFMMDHYNPEEVQGYEWFARETITSPSISEIT